MRIKVKYQRVLSLMLAVLMLFGIFDLTFITEVFAENHLSKRTSTWSEEEIDYFKDRIINEENSDEQKTYIEIEDIDDIKFFVAQNRQIDLGELDASDVGKKLIISYDGNNPLAILEDQDVVALAPNTFEDLYDYVDDVNIDLTHIKYLGKESLGELDEIDISGLENLKFIGDNTFAKATLPTSLNLSNAIYVGNNAFYGANLRMLTLSNSLQYVGKSGFASNLIIYIEGLNNNAHIEPGAFNDNLLSAPDSFITNKDNELISYGGKLNYFEVPDNIETLHIRAFSGTDINSVNLNNIKKILIESDDFEDTYDFGNLEYMYIKNEIEAYVLYPDGNAKLYDEDTHINDTSDYMLDNFFATYINENKQNGLYEWDYGEWIFQGNDNSNDNEGEEKENLFEITKNGDITAYKGTSSNIVIPAEVNGIKVKRLTQEMFNYRHRINSITVEGDIDEVNFNFYNSNRTVDKITFLGDVGRINSNSFYKVNTLEFQGDVDTIDNRAIYYINKLVLKGNSKNTNIYIPYEFPYWGSGEPSEIEIEGNVSINYDYYSGNLKRFINKYGSNPAPGYYKYYSYDWIMYEHDEVNFAGGCGSETQPYLIANEEHFYNALMIKGPFHFKQINDLDFSNYDKFFEDDFVNKVYDGDGYAIKNINYNNGQYTLFGETIEYSEIKNVKIKDVNINLSKDDIRHFGLFSTKIEDSTIHNIEFDNIKVNLNKLDNLDAFGLIAAMATSTTTDKVTVNNVNVNLDLQHEIVLGSLYGYANGEYYGVPNLATVSEARFENGPNSTIGHYIGRVNVNNLTIQGSLGYDSLSIENKELDNVGGIGGLVGASVFMSYLNVDITNTKINLNRGILTSVGGLIGTGVGNLANAVNVDIDINASALSIGGLEGIALGIPAGQAQPSMVMMGGNSSQDGIDELTKQNSNYKDIVIKGKIINKAELLPIHLMIQDSLYGYSQYLDVLRVLDLDVENVIGTGGLVGSGIRVYSENVKIALTTLEGPINLGGLMGASAYVETKDIEIKTDIKKTKTKPVKSINFGGIIGLSYRSDIVGVDFIGNVIGSDNVGGLIGKSSNSLISKADIIGTITGEDNIAGIIGNSHQDNVNKVVTHVNVTGQNNIGGVLGSSEKSSAYRVNLDDSNVSGKNNVGGFAGVSTNDKVVESKMTKVKVKSAQDIVGGILGLGNATKFINNYMMNIDINNEPMSVANLTAKASKLLEILTTYVANTVNNIVFNSLGNHEVYNVENMQEHNNYVNADFDFNDIWRQSPSKNNKLPYLWWEYPGANEELGEAYLLTLSTDKGTLSPEFDKHNNYYEIKLENLANDITINATAEDDGTLRLNGKAFSNMGKISLKEGNNVVTIKVTAKDGIKTNVYTINIINDTMVTLSNLEIENVKLNPSFEPQQTDYTAMINENINSVTIKTETTDENDVYINNKLVTNNSTVVNNLTAGKNVIVVKVITKDKLKQTMYVIQLDKKVIKDDTMITYFPNNVEWGNTTKKMEYVDEKEAPKGSTAEPKEGYDFVHWETLDGIVITTDKTLKPTRKSEAYVAVFKPKEYTVNFVNKDNKVINTQIVKYKGSATAPQPPVEKGLLFLKWSNDSYLSVTEDLTIQAIYKEQGTYAVVYNGNGADKDAYPKMQQVLEGNSGVGTLPAAPIKMGYKFKEWNTHSDGSGQMFTASTIITQDIEVFAQYVPFYMSINANPKIIVADGESTSIITVVIKDENGIPVRNALVEIDAERGSFPEGSATVTNNNGEAKIRFQSEEIKSTSKTDVKVVATVTDKENGLYGTAEISMIFEPSHITGVVLDKNNKPIQHALVVVDEKEIDFYAETLTDAFGRYSIPVAEGNRVYNIKITKPVIVNNNEVNMTFDQKAIVGNITGDKLEIISPEKTLTGVVKVKNHKNKDELTGLLGGKPIEIKQLNGNKLETVGDINDKTGVFVIDNVDKNKEFLMTITTDDNKEVVVGKFVSNVEKGEMKIQEELIDPYGTIRNSFTKDIVGNAEVKLYYADTVRNRAKGNTPDTLVPLPIVNGFLPNDNKNPQKSTPELVFNNDLNVMDHGNYAWLVFSESDYYILATHPDYYDYDSRKDDNLRHGLISVEWDIVKHNFEMRPIRTNEDLKPDEKIVTFIDWNDTVLKREIVKKGKDAIAPSAPQREGYKFIGWDKSFTNVQTDLLVKALYEKSEPEKPVEPEKPIQPRPPVNPGGNWGGSSSDAEKYKLAKEKLDNLIPYTILINTKLDLNEITGINKRDLTYELDTTKAGRTILKANLMGRQLEYKLEVVELVKNTLIFIEKPNHWAIDSARYAIDKGFIVGYTDGTIGLDKTLTYSESFTALDRLLLKNGLIELNISRDKVENKANISENKWYHYPVKSILSKYTNVDKITDVKYDEPINREEIAQILYNSFNEKLKENRMMVNYVDDIEIKNKEAVRFAYNTGLMVGMPDGKFAPKKTLTRAEFMTILNRLDDMLNNK